MFSKFLKAVAVCSAVVSLSSLLVAQGTTAVKQDIPAIPAPPREFRGLWISSVGNGNWPSRPGLPVEQQKAELVAILDKAKEYRLNAIILQVRPTADALYKSDLEPWSYFLTGEQGKAPEPFYDPLTFAVEEAHKRGLQLHAWLNFYRVKQGNYSLAPTSIANTKPNAVRDLGGNTMWMDPSSKEAQDHTMAVILDLVKRYDIDGIHTDDYFYPYKSTIKTNNGEFPDAENYKAYQAGGGKLELADWRRSNVDGFIQRTYKEIKAMRADCVFGIAPFGIWRPGNPEGIVGMDAYNELYADAKKWENEGWLDYIAPQLYWPLSKEGQSFPKLLKWWNEENTKNRHVWAGMSISGIGSQFPITDLAQRILISRRQKGQSHGVIFFSANPFMKNQGDLLTVLGNLFQIPALVPASPWLDDKAPSAPTGLKTGRNPDTGALFVSWQPAPDKDVQLYTVYALVNGRWQLDVAPKTANIYEIPLGAASSPTAFAVSTVDRVGNESGRTLVKLPVAGQ